MPTTSHVAIRRFGLAGVFLVLWTAPLHAQFERLSDRQVRQIVDDVERARNQFEDQLDGDLKSAILRAPTGEVRVDRYLDDLQENVARIKDRMNSQYAASQEVEALLRQCSDIDAFVRSRPRPFRGASEWDAMAAQLGHLAGAYHATFPLPALAAVRRASDSEVAANAESVARAADGFKKALDRDLALSKTVRDARKKDADAVIKQARLLKSRASASKPSTAEMRELLRLTATVSGFVQTEASLPPATTEAWNAVSLPLASLENAYGLKPLPLAPGDGQRPGAYGGSRSLPVASRWLVG